MLREKVSHVIKGICSFRQVGVPFKHMPHSLVDFKPHVNAFVPKRRGQTYSIAEKKVSSEDSEGQGVEGAQEQSDEALGLTLLLGNPRVPVGHAPFPSTLEHQVSLLEKRAQ